jgi:hypothetical protein
VLPANLKPASDLSSGGELAGMFAWPSSSTDAQRQEKENQIKGMIIEWTLPVFDVSPKSDGYYSIQTSSVRGQVGTFCYVKPKDALQEQFILSIKPDQLITCKGILEGVVGRNIEIKPAILVQ